MNQKSRILADLGAAEEAQRRMLPEERPAIEGFSVDFRCVPARYVGGDLYEYIELPGGRWGIAVGDFSGHGLEAAIQMNFIKGHLLATAEAHTDPAGVLCEIHEDFLAHRNSKSDFVSMTYGILDPRSREFGFARAGDTRVLRYFRHRRRKKLVGDQNGSFPIGWGTVEQFGRALVTERFQLEAGDVLFFFTDGVLDATNPRGDEFGETRLRQAILDHEGRAAGEMLKAVFSRLNDFVGEGERPRDDMTLLVLQVDEPEPA